MDTPRYDTIQNEKEKQPSMMTFEEVRERFFNTQKDKDIKISSEKNENTNEFSEYLIDEVEEIGDIYFEKFVNNILEGSIDINDFKKEIAKTDFQQYVDLIENDWGINFEENLRIMLNNNENNYYETSESKKELSENEKEFIYDIESLVSNNSIKRIEEFFKGKISLKEVFKNLNINDFEILQKEYDFNLKGILENINNQNYNKIKGEIEENISDNKIKYYFKDLVRKIQNFKPEERYMNDNGQKIEIKSFDIKNKDRLSIHIIEEENNKKSLTEITLRTLGSKNFFNFQINKGENDINITNSEITNRGRYRILEKVENLLNNLK